MARIRTIKPEFFDDECLCVLPFSHRLGYVGLWTQADRAGRLEDRPKRLKARIFPYDDLDMDALLTDLARAGFIVRYQVDGKSYLAIKESAWRKHQRPRMDEPESLLPPVSSQTVTDSSLCSDGPVAPETLGKEKGKGEGEGNGGTSAEALTRSTPPDDDTPYAAFSVVGMGGPDWILGTTQVETWQVLYPTIDVGAEVAKAVAWIAANPGRRKTAKGMPKFLVNWLNRATDSRGRSAGRPTREPSDYEVRRYEEWVRKLGGCGHQPRCSSRPECLERFITRIRGAA